MNTRGVTPKFTSLVRIRLARCDIPEVEASKIMIQCMVSQNRRKKLLREQEQAKANGSTTSGTPQERGKEKESSDEQRTGGEKRQYTPDNLDLLAFFCTLVKIVFVVGALDLVNVLVKAIGTIRHLSIVPVRLPFFRARSRGSRAPSHFHPK